MAKRRRCFDEAQVELPKWERGFANFEVESAKCKNSLEVCLLEHKASFKEFGDYFDALQDDPVDYEYDSASCVTSSVCESEWQWGRQKIDRNVPRRCNKTTIAPAESFFMRNGRRRQAWKKKIRYNGFFKRSRVSSDSIIFYPVTKLPLIPGGEIVRRSETIEYFPAPSVYVKDVKIVVKNPDSVLKTEHQKPELGDFSISFKNDDFMTLETAQPLSQDFTISLQNNLEKTSLMDADDIKITLENPGPAPKEEPKIPIFGDICLKHFIESNCRNINCPLLHHVPTRFQKNLRGYHPDEIWNSYNFCKDTKFIITVFSCFVRAFVEHKQTDYLIQMFCDVSHRDLNLALEVVQALKSMDFDVKKIVEMLLERISAITESLSDFFLKLLVNENLERNFSVIEKLLDLRQAKLQTVVVNNMVNVAVAQHKPRREIIDKINVNVFQKKLFNLADCEEFLVTRFKSLLK